MNKITMGCNNHGDWFNVKHNFTGLRKQTLDGTLPNCNSQSYILNLKNQAMKFLKENSSIIVVSSDKGGKAVIMDRKDYIVKMNKYLDDNIIAGNYELINDDLPTVQLNVEKAYTEIISLINPFLKLDGYLTRPLTPETFLIPLMYGRPKIHKDDIPMRPIVAATDMIGTVLSTWLLKNLQMIAATLEKYNIQNAKKLTPDLLTFKLVPEHKLCSLDYVSMYTNVNVNETCKIILEYYHVIATSSSVPADVFISCIEFFTNIATFFIFNGKIFKQIKGLAMGNKLAPILAEIRTNYALLKAMENFGAETISFLYKYVDDVFTSIHKNDITAVKDRISAYTNMELTISNEDTNQDVDFLDCTFHRNEDSSISSRWLKKNYSSLSILNYHSYHPMSIKRNIVREMIKNAYAVTSNEFIEDTKELLKKILVNSSYPNSFITKQLQINMHVPNGHRNIEVKKQCFKFVSCPYVGPLIESIKSIVHANDIHMKLAPRPSSNNKRILFSRIKDRREKLSLKNAIFKLNCSDCDFTHTATTGSSDVRRSIQHLFSDKRSPCANHLTSFPCHYIDRRAVVIKSFQDKYDSEHSSHMLRDIERLMDN